MGMPGAAGVRPGMPMMPAGIRPGMMQPDVMQNPAIMGGMNP